MLTHPLTNAGVEGFRDRQMRMSGIDSHGQASRADGRNLKRRGYAHQRTTVFAENSTITDDAHSRLRLHPNLPSANHNQIDDCYVRVMVCPRRDRRPVHFDLLLRKPCRPVVMRRYAMLTEDSARWKYEAVHSYIHSFEQTYSFAFSLFTSGLSARVRLVGDMKRSVW